jgi:hypothetical protein
MRSGKHGKVDRIRLHVRCLARVILLLSLLGNSLALALPEAQPAPEPAPSPISPLPISPPVLDEPQFSSAPGATMAPTGPDARALPPDVDGLPELVDQRTAQSATFEAGDGRFTTVASPQPMHFRDSQGNWQVIDAAFRTGRDSFYVQSNSIRSRAGQRSAWLSAAVGDAAIRWQATALGTVDARGGFTELARALPEPPSLAEIREDGRLLHYADAWSDPRLAEEIISAPGSLEHLLILSEPPRASGTPEFLEMRATLELLPGMTLWADGRQQAAAFRTSGALEIRDAAGQPAIQFDAVRAYEQEDPQVAVAGEYALTPGDGADRWTIGVRTPWAWWNDPGRHYPAAIDPTMCVLQPTGYSNGMAWLSDGTSHTDNPNPGTYQFGDIILGSTNSSSQYRGFIQFNSMPALLTNHPMKVDTATVVITPQYWHVPGYSHKADEGLDWVNHTITRGAQLWPVSKAPSDPNSVPLCADPLTDPTCFSLIDDRLTNAALFSWTTRATWDAPLPASKQLVVGPLNKGGKGQPTSFDVTQVVRDWYDESPRPNHGPAFGIHRTGAHCAYSKNYLDSNVIEDNSSAVPVCTRFLITPENAQLLITYDALGLDAGDNLLNMPGVPSFVQGVFSATNHLYDLNPPPVSDRWRAVAVRGDHDHVAPAPVPVTAGVNVVFEGMFDPFLLAEGGASEEDTSYVLIDDNNPVISGHTLRADVLRAQNNEYPNDQERNYRIEYQQANLWYPPGGSPGQPDGTWRSETFSFSSDRLIEMREFTLGAKDRATIIVSTTAPLDLALVEPTSGDIKSAVRGPHQNADGLHTNFKPNEGPVRTTATGGVPVSGDYALALINTERPIEDPNPGTPRFLMYTVTVSILACPDGTIGTGKYECQPIILPHDVVLPVYPDATESRSALGLTIHSEGGFDDSPPGGQTWCTKDEQLGTPLIGPFDGRWIYVAQGSVCLDDTGGTLFTTIDSGVGLAYRDPDSPWPDGADRGQDAPIVGIYGLPAIYPAFLDATGEVSCEAPCTALLPGEDTVRWMEPFADWESSYTQTSDYIDTGASGGKAVAEGHLSVPLVVDTQDPAYNRSWRVPWKLYPDEGLPANNDFTRYHFEVTVTQPLGGLPSPVGLATLDLRILDGPNGAATGKILEADNTIKTSGPENAQLRAEHAKITQPADLGGTTKRVQAIVQPPGQARRIAVDDPDPVAKNCGADRSCLDLRLPVPDYQWDNGDEVRMWELPDVTVEGVAGSVLLSQPGLLRVFSKDHPHATATEQSFSFDTWGATVKVTEETCGSNDVVTVIRGEAAIALPMLGDDGSTGGPPAPPSVQLGFKLCETELKQAKLILDIAPTYIPVGSTGVGVDLIGGEVTIGPDHTEITLHVGFRSVPSDAVLSNGYGQVTIDTRGMFRLQAGATIVTILDADLLLQVAWEPLDVLVKAQVSAYGGIISGALKLHAWVGQGWQNKYNWLPPNSDFHFAGSIEATLLIKEDLVIEWVPPFDISRSIRIAFGEFCINDPCSDYAWGMSAVMSICGLDVGLYVDEEDGLELIVGTDDHVLIDEYGGSLQLVAKRGPPGAVSPSSPDAPESPAPPSLENIEPPGDLQLALTTPIHSPVDDWPKVSPLTHGCDTTSTLLVHTCPFPIAEGAAGRAVFSVRWLNSGMSITVIKPDNTEITGPGPGVAYTQTLSTGGKRVTFAVTPVSGETLEAGTWKLRLLGPGLNWPNSNIQHHYSIMFATDPPPPTLTWIHPVTQEDGSGQTMLRWSALRASAPITERMELFHTPLADKPLTDTEPISATMIENGVQASDGSYLWDTSALASGEYAVGARIDDHRRGNGHIVSWAPGSVVISDTTPPPPPVISGETFLKDAVVVVWWRDNATQDLAGYLIEHTYPSWDNQDLPRVKRILPSVYSKWWFLNVFEQARIGGLLQGYPLTYCVRAYDASGNPSDCTPVEVTLGDPDRPLGRPENLEASTASSLLHAGASLRATWEPPDSGLPRGYLLGYEPIGCGVPGASDLAEQGLPLIDVGTELQYDLTGLADGQRFLITVMAYDDVGYKGPEATTEAMYADPTDSNSDGLPDAWAAIFGIVGSTADPDSDGLTNIEEFDLGTYPTKADSDRDGFDDDVEVDAGTDPCGPGHPSHQTKPKLVLAGKTLYRFVAPRNLPPARQQKLQIYNFGADTLSWTAFASAPWITLSSTSGEAPAEVLIGVDPAGLSPGRYDGEVTITTSSAGAMSGQGEGVANGRDETATVSVRFVVLPTKMTYVFLPVVLRDPY